MLTSTASAMCLVFCVDSGYPAQVGIALVSILEHAAGVVSPSTSQRLTGNKRCSGPSLDPISNNTRAAGFSIATLKGG
jgi:hypothetical protein